MCKNVIWIIIFSHLQDRHNTESAVHQNVDALLRIFGVCQCYTFLCKSHIWTWWNLKKFEDLGSWREKADIQELDVKIDHKID